MAIPGVYQPQVGPGGSPQIEGVSADAMGGIIGSALEHAGHELDHAAVQAKRIEVEQNRTTQLLGAQADLAKASSENDAFVRDLPKTAAPDKIAEYGLNDWDERTQSLRPTDPKAAQRFDVMIAQQRAELADRLDVMQRGALAGQQVNNAAAASNGIANRVAANPDVATLGASLDQADHLAGSLDQLDPTQREKFRQHLHAQIYSSGVQALNNSNDPTSAAAWLSRPEVQAALPPEQYDALTTQTRVAADRVRSQAKAAANVDFETKSGALELQAQQYQQGRPSFDQAKDMAASYAALAAAAPTPEKRTAAELKAQTWQQQSVEIGASEQYRGASPIERQARIAELAAKPTRTAEEGAELKGLQGQQNYVNSLPGIGRYAYATGRSVPPLATASDWSDPAKVQQRTAIWLSARSTYGGAPDFLLPGEEAPIKEVIKSGTVDQKIGLFQTITRLPGPAARQTLDTLTQGDEGLRATATLASFNDGGERMRLALQGIDAQKANKEMWTRQVDDEKKPLGPTRDELWGSYAPALAGLPAATQAVLRANTYNLYAGSAAKMGWHDFKPDELGRSFRFALGGGKVNGADAGGLGTWNGQQILLPNDMGQGEFDRRLSRATSIAAAAAGSPAWVGDGEHGRAATAAELRSYIPVAIDPHRGLYGLRSGNAFVAAKDGRPFVFDVHRLADGPAPAQRGSEPDMTAIAAGGGIR